MTESSPSHENPNGLVVGLDEVGMGPLAGPIVVVAAAFRGAMPESLKGLTDSKKLSKAKRERLAPLVVEACEAFGVGWATAHEIDVGGKGVCWQFASKTALEAIPGDYLLLVDGVVEVKRHRGPQQTVVKGDQLHWQISAASVLAKIIRDAEMAYLGESYPEYGWAKNSGYGTESHRAVILEKGYTPHHRRTFLRKLLGH